MCLGDAGQDEHDADTVRGAPNGGLSLRQARANYRRFGASAADSPAASESRSGGALVAGALNPASGNAP